MEGRALRPYPPVVVEFDGALAPATVENIDPIAVEWKKRDRRKTKISLPSDPDEAVETGGIEPAQLDAGMVRRTVGDGQRVVEPIRPPGEHLAQPAAPAVERAPGAPLGRAGQPPRHGGHRMGERRRSTSERLEAVVTPSAVGSGLGRAARVRPA